MTKDYKSKTKRLPGLLLLSIALVIGFGIGFGPGVQTAASAPATCPEPVEKWFTCWQNLSTWKTQANSWCEFTDSSTRGGTLSKRDECKFALLGQLNLSPAGLRQIPECATGSTAFNNARVCFASLRAGSWKTALEGFSNECTFTDPSPEDCSETQRREFAEDNDWAPSGSGSGSSSNNAINTNNEGAQSKFVRRISTYIKWISLGLGILAVFGLVISGIQYSAAQDNPQAVSGAKTRIYNIVIGIVIYALMFGLLQWLIPGGLFSL